MSHRPSVLSVTTLYPAFTNASAIGQAARKVTYAEMCADPFGDWTGRQ